MRFARSLIVLAALAAAAPAVRAQQASAEYPGLETGKMWTFDVPPLEYWATRYNFRPSVAWLDHVRQSTLRQPGCTASFVSADGLIMTNHHCARGCIVTATRQGEDLLANGFYARRREDERSCGPNMYVDQLLAITDVTNDVNAAVPAGAAPSAASAARAQAVGGIETRCRAGAADVACQVVTMYRGGQYKLYRFRRYTDIRLVFAPEDVITFFGGDPDNFTYPRHDLDMSYYRAYVNDQPARPSDFFRWSQGAQENDLVFVVGNPGSTGRLNTMAQLEFLRDVQYPATLTAIARQLAVLREVTQADTALASATRNQVFGLENSQKAITGYQAGLLDLNLMNRKRAWEQQFRSRVDADAASARDYGPAWGRVEEIRAGMRALDTRRRYHAFGAYGARLLNYAGLIVRIAAEDAKPDAQRLPAYRQANRAGLERFLYNPAPVNTALETRLLAAYLTAMQSELPAGDPVLAAALGGASPEAAARRMVERSVIATADQRRALVAGGASALAGADDPFIRLAKLIDPLQRDLDAQWTELTDQEAQQDERIARALLAVYGNRVAPDATFSLRISDGEIRTYPYNGTLAQPFTTYYGLFDRSAGFGGRTPWRLPPRWVARRDSIRLATPLNAISTNDIIGGNSGSPVINRDGEVVGLIFDGNIESLPGRFLFTEAANRSVWVDSRGIIEALRRVYDAGALADEMTGGR